MSEIQRLAQAVLEMFDLQKEYFKTRNPEKLTQCKQTEARLKKWCRDALDPAKDPEPDLFSGAD